MAHQRRRVVDRFGVIAVMSVGKEQQDHEDQQNYTAEGHESVRYDPHDRLPEGEAANAVTGYIHSTEWAGDVRHRHAIDLWERKKKKRGLSIQRNHSPLLVVFLFFYILHKQKPKKNIFKPLATRWRQITSNHMESHGEWGNVCLILLIIMFMLKGHLSPLFTLPPPPPPP